MSRSKKTPCLLYIGNFGCVGEYSSVAEAKREAAGWFKTSARATKAGSHIDALDGTPLFDYDARAITEPRKPSITYAFPITFNERVDGRYGVTGGYVDLPGSQFHYGSEAHVKRKARQEVEAFVARAIEAGETRNRARTMFGTNEGSVFLVYYDDGWCHRIAGPGRIMSGMTCANWKDFEEAREAAVRHIDDCFDGVAWETRL